MLSPVALAWASWLGLVVSLAGTMVSLVGLILTFREARRAREAAVAAQSEVSRVLLAVKSRVRLAAFSSAVSQADVIMHRIERDALRSSPELFTAFRRLVKEAVETIVSDTDHGAFGPEELDRRLELIAKLISARTDQKMKRGQMLEAFHDVRSFLIRQEARAKMEDVA